VLFACSSDADKTVASYDLLKSYMKDTLNKDFMRRDHYYVLVGGGGCKGCLVKTFKFFKEVEACKNLSLITNSPYVSDDEEKQVSQSVKNYVRDEHPTRLQNLNLNAGFTPSVIHVKAGKVDSLINMPSTRVVPILKKLPCSK